MELPFYMLWEGMLRLRFVDDLAGAVYDIIKFILRSICLFACRYGNCCSSNVFDILAIWIISVIIFINQINNSNYVQKAHLSQIGV